MIFQRLLFKACRVKEQILMRKLIQELVMKEFLDNEGKKGENGKYKKAKRVIQKDYLKKGGIILFKKAFSFNFFFKKAYTITKIIKCTCYNYKKEKIVFCKFFE